jgi:hypothetical protein
MPTARFQPSFAAGVLGPGLHGRIDIAKYDVGLKVGRNVFVHTHGGVSNRAGTEFIAEVWDQSKTYRLIPFQRDETENYVMVMGDQAMRIIDNGAWVLNGGSPYQPTTPFADEDLDRLDYAQSVDVMFFAHPAYAPRRMARTGATSWTFANLAVDPSGAAPATPTVTASHNDGKTWSYVVAGIYNGIESLPSPVGTISGAGADLNLVDRVNVITWASTGAQEYAVYRVRSGVPMFIGVTPTTGFADDNIAPDPTTTPVQPSGLFGSTNNYPGRVTLFQQRLALAGTNASPETVWMSRTGDYQNFTRSRSLRPDDRVEFTLAGAQINRIRAMLPFRDLLLMTSAAEFAVNGPDGAIVAENPIVTQYGQSGSIAVRPLVVDDTALFVDRTGNAVRDLRFAFEQDGYAGNELTIFAPHFFEGKRIVDWTFCQAPYSIIWTVLDDGTLLSLTYKREHQIWAWTEHDIGGDVLSVTSIREGNEDALYLLVRRTINGQSRQYIERLHSRQFTDVADAFFVDCGLSFAGNPPSKTFTGLGHLEGEAVAVLADGSVIEGLTVTGGEITLPTAASKVHVGLPYTAEIENLPPAIDLQDVGSGRGRPHAVSKVRVQVEKTRGIEIAGADRIFYPYVNTPADLSQPFAMKTGMIDVTVGAGWNSDGTVVIRQRYPLPMTVLGISPELSIGRSG